MYLTLLNGEQNKPPCGQKWYCYIKWLLVLQKEDVSYKITRRLPLYTASDQIQSLCCWWRDLICTVAMITYVFAHETASETEDASYFSIRLCAVFGCLWLCVCAESQIWAGSLIVTKSAAPGKSKVTPLEIKNKCFSWTFWELRHTKVASICAINSARVWSGTWSVMCQRS